MRCRFLLSRLTVACYKCWIKVGIINKAANSFWTDGFLLYCSSSRIMSNLFMVVTITLRSGVKPNLSSQRPLSLITGTVVWLHRLILVSGWIFRLRTSGRLIVLFLSLCVRITFKDFKSSLAVLRTHKKTWDAQDFHLLSARQVVEYKICHLDFSLCIRISNIRSFLIS